LTLTLARSASASACPTIYKGANETGSYYHTGVAMAISEAMLILRLLFFLFHRSSSFDKSDLF